MEELNTGPAGIPTAHFGLFSRSIHGIVTVVRNGGQRNNLSEWCPPRHALGALAKPRLFVCVRCAANLRAVKWTFR